MYIEIFLKSTIRGACISKLKESEVVHKSILLVEMINDVTRNGAPWKAHLFSFADRKEVTYNDRENTCLVLSYDGTWNHKLQTVTL